MNGCDPNRAPSFLDNEPGANEHAGGPDDSDLRWASTPANWSPSLMDFGVGDAIPAPLPDAESWAVADSEIQATQDLFALEIRAEIIEQRASGHALRRGDIETIAAGRSRGNHDIVVGRDRVRVNGKLREHTGGDFSVRASHVETTVDGNVDVDVKQDYALRIAGNLKDAWHGGMTTAAANVGDFVYGVGFRCSAPLFASTAGVATRGFLAGYAAADGVLAEFCGTLFNRETGTSTHQAACAAHVGSLYIAERPGFLPMMRIATGVRNLVAGAGEDSQQAPADSAPPPAQEGSGTASVASSSTTISSGSTATTGTGASAGAASGAAP